MAMAAAALVAPALAQSDLASSDCMDLIEQGVFMTHGSAFKFPAASNTNFDSIDVGNDRALAIGVGTIRGGVLNQNAAQISAQNNLRIKKSQDTGDSGTCDSCSPKYNVEHIKVRDRAATAIGVGFGQGGVFSRNAVSTMAQNNVEIVTSQQ